MAASYDVLLFQPLFTISNRMLCNSNFLQKLKITLKTLNHGFSASKTCHCFDKTLLSVKGNNFSVKSTVINYCFFNKSFVLLE